MAPLPSVTRDPSAPYDGAPPQRSWGGGKGARNRSLDRREAVHQWCANDKSRKHASPAVRLRRRRPVGHGFAVLSEEADVAYQVSSYYDPATEKGIAWDDPGVGVDWEVSDPLLSERDKTAPTLAEIGDELPF